MKKNLVVIGYGGMGAWHVNKALNSDVVNVTGIYDIDPAKNKAAEEKGLFVYDSYDAVLADSKVDIVTIATPNDVHKELAVKALNAGKNVICEKPVAMSLAELDEMIEAANKNNRIFSVHQNRRFDTDFLAIKNLKESGEIGDFINYESRIFGSRGIPGDWRRHKEFGGGMMLDWGVHLIDQTLQMFKENIEKVHCVLDHVTSTEVDDGFRATIYFEGGAYAFIEVGTYNFIQMFRHYVRAQNGCASISDWHGKCKISGPVEWIEEEVTPVQTAAGLTKTMAPRDFSTLKEYEIDQPSSDVHDYYRNFCNAIDGKEEQLVTHAEMRKVMKVMEACFESDRLGQVVKFEN